LKNDINITLFVDIREKSRQLIDIFVCLCLGDK